MAFKISVKRAVVILFSCGIFLILGACINPVDLQTFLQDEHVQEIIETAKTPPPAVKVDDKTGDGLVGRSGKIEGLKPDRYYMVEKELDANGVLVNTTAYPMYVSDYPGFGPGGLINDLGFITRISDGSINDLFDLHTYTVRAATAFSDTALAYTDSAGASNQPINVISGKINLPAPTGNFTLDLTVAGGLTSGTSYEVIAVSASTTSKWNSFSGSSYKSKTGNGSTWNALPLEGAGTTVDYLFVNKADLSDFKVLTVIIAPMDTVINIAAIAGVTVPVAGGTPVSAITETAQYTGTVIWSGNPAVFGASTIYTATITLTPKTGFTLTGVTPNFFTVAGTSAAANAADSGVITAAFPSTAVTINIPAIPGITAPATGGPPVSAITETAQYTGTVTWNGNPATFAASTVYTATITLTPKAGFTAFGVPLDYFSVTGATPVNNPVNSGIITAVFPSTAPPSGGSVNVGITFTIDEISTITPSSGVITIGALNGASTVTLTLNVSSGSASNIKWYHDGILLSGSGNILGLSNSPSSTYMIVGTHVFTVTLEVNGDPYSANFTLTVNEK
jgi:hypothetical protein